MADTYTSIENLYVDYGGARLEYPRCLGKGCPARRRTGPDFYCSVECLTPDLRRAHYERLAAAYNAA